VSASVSPDSLSALKDFHSDTNGDAWNYPLGDVVWNFTQNNADPCSDNWSGITCDQTAIVCATTLCDILGISLSNYGLFGQLPASIMKLTSLNLLKIEKNSLFGSIPWNYFYSMTTLSYLYLNENNFQGSLPNDIHKLAHVNLLKLRENNLIGTIPESFGDISNLGRQPPSLLTCGECMIDVKLNVECVMLCIFVILYANTVNYLLSNT
jgi:hypothetical protein